MAKASWWISKNTVILLTLRTSAPRSSCEPAAIQRNCRISNIMVVEMIRPELLQHFRPSLLGRLVIVPYYPLGDEHIKGIVRLKLGKIQQRFRDNHRATLTYDAELVNSIAARCTEVDSGARNVDHILTNTLLPAGGFRRVSCSGWPDGGMHFPAVHVSLDPAG